MSKTKIPTAAAQPLVTLTVTREEFAEIRDLVETILGNAVTGADNKTGLELAEAAERVTPAKLRKENARYIALSKAGSKGVPDTVEPVSECKILHRQAGIVRKLVAAESASAVQPNAPAAAPGSAQVFAPTADDHIETFSIKLPREITRWLRVDAEEEGKTPEQYIAEAAGEACGCVIASGVFSDEIKERWKELAVEANSSDSVKGDGRAE